MRSTKVPHGKSWKNMKNKIQTKIQIGLHRPLASVDALAKPLLALAKVFSDSSSEPTKRQCFVTLGLSHFTNPICGEERLTKHVQALPSKKMIQRDKRDDPMPTHPLQSMVLTCFDCRANWPLNPHLRSQQGCGWHHRHSGHQIQWFCHFWGKLHHIVSFITYKRSG